MSIRGVRQVGLTALLVEVDGPGAAADLATWLREQAAPALDLVPGAATVLVDGVVGASGLAAVRDLLSAAPDPGAPPAVGGAAGGAVGGEEIEIAVVYDGPDLDDVARRWGTDRAGVIAQHTGTSFTSAFCGFAPGFAYLGGLPSRLAVPRRATPRTRVPPGSVALADTWCGVYPAASPGGWLLLGRTDAVLWRPEDPSPALLAPGTRVRFVDRSVVDGR